MDSRIRCPVCASELEGNSTCLDCVPIGPLQGPASTDSRSDFDVQVVTKSPLYLTRLEPGTLVQKRYRIMEMVGAGGMGEVYKAEDLQLGGIVAIKLLALAFADDDFMVDLFKNEVRTARAVTNPYVCRVHDIGEDSGRFFLSMSFVDGIALDKLILKNGLMRQRKALTVAWQLCCGIVALHENEILHGDLKPANVMVDGQERVQITDFGLAGRMKEISRRRFMGGTPRYMAPEQLIRDKLTCQTDIFSLGLILYEIFTGKRAIKSRSHEEVAREHAVWGVRSGQIRSDLPRSIRNLVMPCLAMAPSLRPESAMDVYRQIGCLLRVSRARVAAAVGQAPPLSKTEPLNRSKASRWRSMYELFRWDRLTSGLGTGNRVSSKLDQEILLRSPFVSGRVVRGEDFMGREMELATILDRVYKGESSVVLGHGKSGKSSLLHRLAEAEILRDERDPNIMFHWLDMDASGPDFSPSKFWATAIEPIYSLPADSECVVLARNAAVGNYSSGDLQCLFSVLCQQGFILVLLLDEFDRLVESPAFRGDQDFFALVRSIATNSGGFAIVGASRLSVSQLTKIIRIGPGGSPPFNHLVDVILKPYDEAAIIELVKRGDAVLLPGDVDFIRSVAGRHPYLLQLLGSALFASRGQERRILAAQTFNDRAVSFFEELWLWEGMSNRARAVLLIVALSELAGQKEGRPFDYSEISSKDDLTSGLKILRGLGLVESMSGVRLDLHQYCIVWRGERWSVGFHCLLWWFSRLVCGEVGAFPEYEEWLRAKRYQCFLNEGEWASLVDSVRGGQDVEERIASHVTEYLWEELA